MSLRGTFSRTIDPKGRLILPSDFREAIASPCEDALKGDSGVASLNHSFILTTLDGCLVAYSKKDFNELEEKFRRIPNPSKKVRDFKRGFIGGAEELTPDAQGRILLSPNHREYAGLEREAAIVGMVDRFEIWNPSKLRASTEPENFEGVSDELAASGIVFSL